MMRTFRYELWDGKSAHGYFNSTYELRGQHLIVPELSVLKAPYNRKLKYIKVPINYRLVEDNGCEITSRRVLDVSRKSKRQIKILKGGQP